MKKEDIKKGQFVWVIEKDTGAVHQYKIVSIEKKGVMLDAAQKGVYGRIGREYDKIWETKEDAERYKTQNPAKEQVVSKAWLLVKRMWKQADIGHKKILSVRRKGSTFAITVADFKTRGVNDIYVQFSTKDPWLKPAYKSHYGEMDIPLYGWLFFYFGMSTVGLLFKRKPNRITGKGKTLIHNHCSYMMQAANNREQADTFRFLSKYRIPVKIKGRNADTLSLKAEADLPVKKKRYDRYDYTAMVEKKGIDCYFK